MLSIVRTKYGVQVNDIFFSNNPTQISSPSLISFFVQAAKQANGLQPAKTSIIDLRRPLGELFSQISSSTRYKIRRAEREGVTAEFNQAPTEEHVLQFATFFDEFATQKSLPKSNRKKMLALCAKQALILTHAKNVNGQNIAMHAYIADYDSMRIRLLYSASHFRGTSDSEQRNRIGRANRLLHWFEIERSKDLGLERYDLGGLPVKAGNVEKDAIAQFKLEFGGSPLVEYSGFASRNSLLQYSIPMLRRVFA